MLPVVVIAAGCFGPYPDDPPVRLDDAYKFCVQPEVAHFNYWIALHHITDELRWTIHECNPPEVADQWEADVQWRRQCWSDLEDVLFWKHEGEDGLRKMRRLRHLLGDRAYYSGRMPAPTPNYTVAK